ncbi:VirB4-like conjugal transfer ATPase, CD1110 family [Acutalibacter intestini]|uniref:VirB4-like conjugal transfer ATPase, CD1110 family n=1 Tax=Acutalibacter intestini TaxID=3093659 RepID=UPI002AC9ADB9|nr:hypothetical protein [Acutalibacter sp. M00204]
MIKSIKTIMRQDREPYRVPRRVQDVIPIQCVWPDGIFKVGIKFSKTYRFTDINYKVASREDKETMFLAYSELLNGLDSAATTKLTICNRRQSQADFEQSVLMAMRGDGLDKYRKEYNQMLIDKATGANGIIQEKLVTVTVYKRDIEDARAYFTRIGADLTARFAALGSKCVELDAADRLRILHDFYRAGDEGSFHFDMADMARKGHDFRDYICPDGIEKHSDYLKLGDRYCRVLFLKDYANYIQDEIVADLTDLNRNTGDLYENAKHGGPAPTLTALREMLLEQPESEARGIALALELFTTGSLDIFGHESTVDLDKRVVVFDIHGLGEQLKPIGHLVITDTMLNRVTLNWKKGKRTHVFIDEFHVMFENEFSAAFFNSAWRQFRKRNAYPTAITQNVEYLLDSVQASTMLSNSEFIVMLNQAASDREKLARLLNISEEQMGHITNAPAGCGLIKYGSALVPFVNRFPSNTELYRLMTTRPGEGRFSGGRA